MTRRLFDLLLASSVAGNGGHPSAISFQTVTYGVTILPRAKRQLLEQALWWSENRSAEQAYRWLDGFERALESLANHPERCSASREDDAFDVMIRELHFGLGNKATHRAVFEI